MLKGACFPISPGDDGDLEAQAAADSINWRTYVDRNKLSDKQQKVLDKIR